jgi:hypothetical protein
MEQVVFHPGIDRDILKEELGGVVLLNVPDKHPDRYHVLFHGLHLQSALLLQIAGPVVVLLLDGDGVRLADPGNDFTV